MLHTTSDPNPDRIALNGEQPVVTAQSSPATERANSEYRRRLLCGFCRAPITGREEAIAVNGAWHHSFVNPHGVVYHVGCYASARGCRAEGEPTLEWTWFPGFQWQLALCRACGSHLGWYYTSGYDQAFYGLIADRLFDAGTATGPSS